MNYKLDFVKARKWFFLFSIATILLGVVSLFTQGLNLGIDFVSGSRLDINIQQAFDKEKADAKLAELGYPNPNTRVAGNNKELLVFRTDKAISKEKVNDIRDAFRKDFGKKVAVNEQTVDPIIGRELARNAIYSVLIASIGIIAYITLRFEYRFAFSAIIAILYDALFTIGLFSIFQWEVDIVFIAAVLTIVGYSINDTIVIFDRIRENLKRENPKTFEALSNVVNVSIQQTLVRSINTVLTVIFAAVALLIFGGESIKYFSIALLVGLFSGAYSSICIASQIWVGWKWRSLQKERLKPQSAE
ncbi:preprotein translocase subunit SecF/SecD/SecF fusion protein [Marininema mesophilum]|uniref:Protein-export membrane protein SecF n=1 Tax=Marininema mesophilum TaxID=1048340 RepID=A0A1H2SBV3_9BACL|nr:protein translocase subunit SecF [Marininema mesophilum]SDW29116.1 preprotein translocase subunit SecF/SecD/SecF fusion protein [Marininema mesophilum]